MIAMTATLRTVTMASEERLVNHVLSILAVSHTDVNEDTYEHSQKSKEYNEKDSCGSSTCDDSCTARTIVIITSVAIIAIGRAVRRRTITATS